MNIRIKFKKALSIILTVSTVICMLSVFSANADEYKSGQKVDVSNLKVGDVIRKGATINNNTSKKVIINFSDSSATVKSGYDYKTKCNICVEGINNNNLTVSKITYITYRGYGGNEITNQDIINYLPSYCKDTSDIDLTVYNAELNGYVSGGFYPNQDCCDADKLSSIEYKDEIEIYLKPQTYTVTFANTTLSSVSYKYGEGLTLNGIVPTLPTGCTFAYWSYSEDLSLGETDTITETDYGDKIFYPAYNCSIAYYDEDGKTVLSVEGAPTSYTEGVGVADLTAYSPTNIPEGKTFAGWYSSASGGTPMTNISKSARGCINLYARYTEPDKFITSSVGGYMLDSNSNKVYIVAFGAEYTDTDEVTAFGFYVYGKDDSTGTGNKLELTASEGNKLNETNNKFYIYADSVSLGTTYYAKAYIKIGETIYTSPIISCTPDKDKFISN